jgi:DnaJ-class molecular chaperone
MRTNYQILGISKKATPEQIKRTYRTLVKSCHPDLFVSGSEEQARAGNQLREINAAYAILSNPQKRTTYDAKLSKIRSGSEPKPEYCYRCGKPTLYWEIERDKTLCNDCGRTAAAATGFN